VFSVLIKRICVAGALAGAALSVSASAQSGWTTVGQVRIASDASTATIPVRWQKQFREIMFCLEGHGVRLQTVTIQMGEARPRAIRLGANLPNDGCSRATSVGKNKDVTAVDITYDSATLQGDRTKVQMVAR
jgi:hypothetical protein